MDYKHNKKTIAALQRSKLFAALTSEEIESILQNSYLTIKNFNKDDYIAYQGDECFSVGIVMEGSAVIKKLFASGNAVTIATIKPLSIFGEALIFSSNNKYPSTIIAAEKMKVIFIAKDSIIKMCSANNRLLRNYLAMLSDKMLMLVNKIEYLSYQTIKQKLAALFLEQYSLQSNKQIISLPYNRKEMAEELGITRPSLSREMAKLKKDKIIDYRKNIVEIMDLNKLESILKDD